MAGIEDGAVGELTLHRYGTFLGCSEKHKRIYHGTAHLAALPSPLHHGGLNRDVALCAVGRQLLFYSKNFVVEHLQGIPMQSVIFRFNHSRKDTISIPAHRGFFNLQRTASRVSPLIFHLSKNPGTRRVPLPVVAVRNPLREVSPQETAQPFAKIDNFLEKGLWNAILIQPFFKVELRRRCKWLDINRSATTAMQRFLYRRHVTYLDSDS